MENRDNAFVTMLLTMSLSPNREEYAHPLSTQELRRLEERVRKYDLGSTGRLLGMDISGMMLKLDISEEEAYRLFTLLNRSVQLTYAIENLASRHNIAVVATQSDQQLTQLTGKMGDSTPPVLYTCGNFDCLNMPLLAILGNSGVKTTPEVRSAVEFLVKKGTAAGYAILTGCEPGVAFLAANLTLECGGTLVSVAGGDMTRHITEAPMKTMMDVGKGLILSVEHPEAIFTVSHQITRNKLMLAMSEAAFILNSDGKRGEIDAIRNHYCDWIYAWTGCAENKSLIARGAYPIADIPAMNFDTAVRSWRSGEAQQMSLFDLL